MAYTPFYQTAPPSPNGGINSPNDLQFYSAPSSPVKGGEDLSPNFDDFEFETSKRFGIDFDKVSENFDDHDYYFPLGLVKEKQEKPKRERCGCSLPPMAFADELFANGLVMPLKPPPRLQSWNDQRCFTYGSIPSSPKSSNSTSIKNSFFRRAAWNDDFDPFKVALEKVSEEKRGRSSISSNTGGILHRRTRSHSPFRTSKDTEYSVKCDQLVQNSESQFFKMHKELKGSPYARWVLDQTKQVEQLNPEGKKMIKGFTFVTRVRPMKSDNDQGSNNNKAIFGKKFGDHQDEGINNDVWEKKMKKIKGFLHRYASFRKDSSEEISRNQTSKMWGSAYLKKLSFKMKGNNASENGEKPKVALVEYKPTIALCYYGIESPRNKK